MDDDDKKSEDAAAEPAPDAAQDEGAKLREVSEDELEQIHAAHKTWLETGGKEGERADLSDANLQEADLSDANLRGAILVRANLQEANLIGANLQEADLRRANLQGANLGEAKLRGANLANANLQEAKLFGANLQGAHFYGADLSRAELSHALLRDGVFQNANLKEVKGLLGGQLAGANVSGARQPDEIAAFDVLDNIAEISKNARKVFVSMLLGCVYTWLTIATTTDLDLIANTASSPLPIIGTEIPIVSFYIVAPLILTGTYAYLGVYMHNLWRSLARLPAIFPDGEPLDTKAYPWLAICLVRGSFTLLKSERSLVWWIQWAMTVFLAWSVVPLTLTLFWGRVLPRHDWWLVGLHICLLVLATWGGIMFYRLAMAVLRGEQIEAFSWKRVLTVGSTYRQMVGLLAIAAIVFAATLGTIEGVPGSPAFGKPRTWMPAILAGLGHRAFAKLPGAELSAKPENWQDEEGGPLELVSGANLAEWDLRYADMRDVFLAKADLTGANLQGAYLRRANLQGANLREADLKSANLQGAKLQGANLDRANLREASLPVNLQGVDLKSVNLQGAKLTYANLQGADLRRADLRGANLRHADLQEADLGSANLQGANLADAKGLTRERLDWTCGDDETKLPNHLADYQIEPCPESWQSSPL